MNTGIAKIMTVKREDIGMTQAELASKLGIDQSMVSRFEKGTKIPSLPLLINLADIFGCSLDELVGRRRAS